MRGQSQHGRSSRLLTRTLPSAVLAPLLLPVLATPAAAQAAALPGAPPSVTATAGVNQAAVAWTAAPDNGQAIERYVVTAYKGATPTLSQATPGTATGAILSGLAGGTAYTFRVTAANASGDGPPATSSAVTPTGAATTYATGIVAHAPTVYYRLGEQAGTTAADSSGHGHHGQYNPYGPVGLAKPGALPTDPDMSAASQGCCVVQASPTLPLGNTARTIEAWVKPADQHLRYVASWGTWTTRGEYSVAVDATGIELITFGDDRRFDAPRRIDDGAWHHVVVAYDGTAVRAYLDGASLGTQAYPDPLDTGNTEGFFVGARAISVWDASWTGGLDEVAVYPRALSATQVSAHFAASGYSKPGAAITPAAAFAGPNAADVSWGVAPSGNAPLARYIVTALTGDVVRQSVAVSGAKTAVRFTGLAGGTPHTFRVVAGNPYGDGPAATTPEFAPTGSPTTYAAAVSANSPVAYYRLGERSGQLAADSSGRGRHAIMRRAASQPGALQSDPDLALGGDGQCCMLDAPPVGLPLFDAARTVEAWVKPSTEEQRYVLGWGGWGVHQEFSLMLARRAIVVVVNSDDRWFPVSRPLNDGVWHHVAVTYDGQSVTAYLDGQAVGTQVFGVPLDTLDDLGLTIGGSASGENWSPFAGGLDEVAVYATALAPADIAAHFSASGWRRPTAPTGVVVVPGANKATVSWNPPSGLATPLTRYVVTAMSGTTARQAEAAAGTATSVEITGLQAGAPYSFRVMASNAYGDGAKRTTGTVTPTGTPTTYASTVLDDAPLAFYRLGEQSGAAAADSSGRGRHGESERAERGTPGAPRGDGDTAVGARQGCCVVRAMPALPVNNSARTVEVWLRPDTEDYADVLGWGSTASGRGFGLVIDHRVLRVEFIGSNRSWALSGPLNDGVWHHVAVTYDGVTMTAYLDGVSLGGQKLSGPLLTVAGDGLTVGSWFNEWQAFAGDIDEVAVYGKALSAARVAAHFAAAGYRRPPAVTDVVALPGTNRATISWSAAGVPDDGVTRYLVTAFTGGRAVNAEAVDGATTSVVLTGLAGGTTYTFRIVATNPYGDGPAAESAPVTPTGSATTYPSGVLADGPSAYYRLGETTGGLLADSSGRGGHAELDPDSGASPGAPGAFNGDSDTSFGLTGGCCFARSAPQLPLFDEARSVEAWVRPNGSGPNAVASWGAGGSYQEFTVMVDRASVGVVVQGGDRWFAAPRRIDDGAWHHVAVTYDGTAVRAYLDGASLGSQLLGRPLETLPNDGLRLGSRITAPWDHPFSGRLDDVAVYAKALTSAQVSSHFLASGYRRPGAAPDVTAIAGANRATISWSPAASPTAPVTRYTVTAYRGTVPSLAESVDGTTTNVVLSGLVGGAQYTFKVVPSNPYGDGSATTSNVVTPTGPATTYASSVLAQSPVAYYRFGETSGTTAADSSGRAKHAWYGEVDLGAAGAVEGDPDTAASFNSGLSTRSRPPLPQNNSARSVEAWVQVNTWYPIGIAGWGGAPGRSFSVLVGPDQIRVSTGNAIRDFRTAAPVNDGQWHHVAVTYDGTSMRAYVDGAAIGTQAVTTPLRTLNPGGLVVGADSSESNNYFGGLDEVAVYATALTAADVAAHFAAKP